MGTFRLNLYMSVSEKLRIDKYLWAIRLFKTRALASDACKAGRVKLEGTAVKPAHLVKVGETYTIRKGAEQKIIQVLDLLERRVDAKTAVSYYVDLSPKEEINKVYSVFDIPMAKRERGAGRPTKKDRRDMDSVRNTD